MMALMPFVYGTATSATTNNFGFTGDFTYIVQHPKFEAFAPATMSNTDKIVVPLGRAGIYYREDFFHMIK